MRDKERVVGIVLGTLGTIICIICFAGIFYNIPGAIRALDEAGRQYRHEQDLKQQMFEEWKHNKGIKDEEREGSCVLPSTRR